MDFDGFLQDNVVGGGRCPVCALPLPTGGRSGQTCSRRCSTWRRKFGILSKEDVEGIGQRVLERLARLERGCTLCPGQLAADVVPESAQGLVTLRPVLFYLAQRGLVRLTQRGHPIRWDQLRGPYRVGKPRR